MITEEMISIVTRIVNEYKTKLDIQEDINIIRLNEYNLTFNFIKSSYSKSICINYNYTDGFFNVNKFIKYVSYDLKVLFMGYYWNKINNLE